MICTLTSIKKRAVLITKYQNPFTYLRRPSAAWSNIQMIKILGIDRRKECFAIRNQCSVGVLFYFSVGKFHIVGIERLTICVLLILNAGSDHTPFSLQETRFGL